MTLLGLDLDNTIISYDNLFHKLALEKNLIEPALRADKRIIRDHIRAQGKDDEFTVLQGEAYGKRILEAEPFNGALETIKALGESGVKMVIVSHKTKAPYKGPAYDLHESARSWLERHGFFEQNKLGWTTEQVFFEETKRNKVARIESLGCTHYVDDLEEILLMLHSKITKIWFTSIVNSEPKNSNIIKIFKWSELNALKLH